MRVRNALQQAAWIAVRGLRRNIARIFLPVAVAAFAAGCASQSDDSMEANDEFGYVEESVNDPLEIPNRFIFAINDAIDTILVRPAAVTYRFVLPQGVQDSVRNFFRNLETPVVLANDIFQGEWGRAEDTFARFLINSTVGVGGLFDVAADAGHPYHEEDFGQTLGAYGVGEGFYVVLPLLGPSSARDGSGLLVDSLLDPLTYVLPQEALLGRRIISGIDTRARNIDTLDELRKDSIDFYARIRSLYRQTRESEIRQGELPGAASGF